MRYLERDFYSGDDKKKNFFFFLQSYLKFESEISWHDNKNSFLTIHNVPYFVRTCNLPFDITTLTERESSRIYNQPFRDIYLISRKKKLCRGFSINNFPTAKTTTITFTCSKAFFFFHLPVRHFLFKNVIVVLDPP